MVKLSLGMMTITSWPKVTNYSDVYYQHKPEATISSLIARPEAPTPIPTGPPARQMERPTPPLLAAVNDYRRQQGKSELKPLTALCEAARGRAAAVGRNLDHSGYLEAIKAMPHSASAENLWWGTDVSTAAVVQAWIESGGHRDNLLAEWTYGCGEIVNQTAAFLFIR